MQCVVTSPPYFGLRDYGTATWDGGDPECDHGAAYRASRNAGRQVGVEGGVPGSERDPVKTSCKCGATRIDAQIGLEASPDLFIAEMVAVFRMVWRVLRDDGTLWLNLGDSYNAYNGGAGPGSKLSQTASAQRPQLETGCGLRTKSLKPKDLLMMPARVAIALQADGWWLRSDIIWHKPNPMPESCNDRPTTSHEHVFLLTKRAKYFYDADAVREEGVIPAGTLGAKGSEERFAQPGVNSRPPEYKVYSGTRNLRNVWTIATHAYPDAHFATFPPELAERCIKAGTSEKGACPACGAPWVRQTDTTYDNPGNRTTNGPRSLAHKGTISAGYAVRLEKQVTTTGWQPTCDCPHNAAQTVPCTVLDPFSGAGTTALVADRLGRRAIGIELNPQYATMARDRVIDDAPLFAEVS